MSGSRREGGGRPLAGRGRGAGPVGPIELPFGLLDPALAFRSCMIGTHGVDSLHADEAGHLSPHAVEIRRQEFAAGRACARSALKSLGVTGHPVVVAEDGVPVWPGGTVGSISHTRQLAAAAVGLHSDGFASVGLDIEVATPLEAGLFDEICKGEESAWLDGQPEGERGLLAKAIFCAKEAAYKCQYPLSRTLFGFETLHVDLDLPARRFSARFRQDIPPFEAGYEMTGSIAVAAGHFVAMLFLRSAAR